MHTIYYNPHRSSKLHDIPDAIHGLVDRGSEANPVDDFETPREDVRQDLQEAQHPATYRLGGCGRFDQRHL